MYALLCIPFHVLHYFVSSFHSLSCFIYSLHPHSFVSSCFLLFMLRLHLTFQSDNAYFFVVNSFLSSYSYLPLCIILPSASYLTYPTKHYQSNLITSSITVSLFVSPSLSLPVDFPSIDYILNSNSALFCDGIALLFSPVTFFTLVFIPSYHCPSPSPLVTHSTSTLPSLHPVAACHHLSLRRYYSGSLPWTWCHQGLN